MVSICGLKSTVYSTVLGKLDVPHPGRGSIVYWRKVQDQKTFYLETFGCQMNVHDSEKVVGTLTALGYTRVARPEEAGLVL
jgi:hypothetical protein